MIITTDNYTQLKDNHATAALALARQYNWRVSAAYDVLMYMNPYNAGNALSKLVGRLQQYSSPLDQAGEFLDLVEEARS